MHWHSREDTPLLNISKGIALLILFFTDLFNAYSSDRVEVTHGTVRINQHGEGMAESVSPRAGAAFVVPSLAKGSVVTPGTVDHEGQDQFGDSTGCTPCIMTVSDTSMTPVQCCKKVLVLAASSGSTMPVPPITGECGITEAHDLLVMASLMQAIRQCRLPWLDTAAASSRISVAPSGSMTGETGITPAMSALIQALAAPRMVVLSAVQTILTPLLDVYGGIYFLR